MKKGGVGEREEKRQLSGLRTENTMDECDPVSQFHAFWDEFAVENFGRFIEWVIGETQEANCSKDNRVEESSFDLNTWVESWTEDELLAALLVANDVDEADELSRILNISQQMKVKQQ